MLSDVMECYEVGFLLSPLIAPEALAETVDREFKAGLTAAGGKAKNETAPRMVKLAYPLRKVVEHKSTVFNEAYFGSLVFDAEPAVVAELAARWRQSPLIIRLLLINYPEDRLIPHARRVAAASVETAPEGETASAPAAAAVIDKEIENLLTPIA